MKFQSDVAKYSFKLKMFNNAFQSYNKIEIINTREKIYQTMKKISE